MQSTGVPIAAGQLSNPDFVQYHIFLREYPSSGTPPAQIQGQLLGWLVLIQKKVDSFLSGFIWQQDPFRLRLYCPESTSKSSNSYFGKEYHLYGRMSFGDNIEDEWLVVWLLMQISKEFPQLLIRVFDSDGEFLLIEAAYVIPRWLKPENSDMRVWLRAGHVVVIPPPRTPAELLSRPAKLDLPAALQAVRASVETGTSAVLQPLDDAIATRVKDLPRAALDATHVARCIVPAPVARLLRSKPQLVAAAVVAFYERDLDAMRAVKAMTHFSMTAHSLQPTMVRFTRTLYAQLSKQRFQTPAGSSHFPPLPTPTHPDFKALDLGMKLTCGFEILCSRKSSAAIDSRPLVTEFIGTNPIDDDARWAECSKFLASHQLDPTALNRAKLEACAQLHRKQCTFLNDKSTAAQMHYLLRATDYHLTPEIGIRPDDSESWLDVTPESVNDLLDKKQREIDAALARAQKKSKPSVDSDGHPDDVVEDITSFVNTVSSHEGAEPRAAGGQLDAERFLRVLRSVATPSALGAGPARVPDEDASSDASDDLYDEPDENDEEGELPSDEELTEAERAEFVQSLQAMEAELASSTMAESFERVPEPKDDKRTAGDGLPPVDLNLNLMKNLLESVAGQQGNAGPFANMLSEIAAMKSKAPKK